MLCQVCNQPLKPQDALTDGNGLSMRVHQKCLSGVDNESHLIPPDYQPTTATVSMPPFVGYADVKPLPVDSDGKFSPKPTRKASQADLLGLAGKVPLPHRVLCGREASESERHVVHGVTLYAHDGASRVRARFRRATSQSQRYGNGERLITTCHLLRRGCLWSH